MLGLCLGLSLISVIELFYFITVRFYQNVAKTNEENNAKKSPKIDAKQLKENMNMFKPRPVYNYKDIELSLANYNDRKFIFVK